MVFRYTKFPGKSKNIKISIKNVRYIVLFFNLNQEIHIPC